MPQWLTYGGPGVLLLALFYGFWIEPAWRLRVKRWRVEHPAWAGRGPLRIVILTDIHAGAPHIPLSRVSRIVRKANRLKPDLAVILGDFAAAHRFAWGRMTKAQIIARLTPFTSPLGTFSVLGNHDWWQDEEAARAGRPCEAELALARAGIPHLNNDAVRLEHDGAAFWLLGLGDQRPFDPDPGGPGFDDLDAAMGQVGDDAPAILLAHEPDLFPHVPDQVILTLSGHTHGGQVRIGNRSPILMAAENERFSYGRYDSDGKVLIVGGGIGCSELPLRVNMPPEITVVTLCAPGG